MSIRFKRKCCVCNKWIFVYLLESQMGACACAIWNNNIITI
nr:MAG TPA: hypothetical protein [Caudoviricetes sp.]